MIEKITFAEQLIKKKKAFQAKEKEEGAEHDERKSILPTEGAARTGETGS